MATRLVEHGTTRTMNLRQSMPVPGSKLCLMVISIGLAAIAWLLAGCSFQQETSTPTVLGSTPTAIPQATISPEVSELTTTSKVEYETASVTPSPLSSTPSPNSPAFTPSFTPVSLTPTSTPLVPPFSHIFIIVLENKEFGTVIGPRRGMPNFNQWASEYTLLTQFYAIRHPSLPNYLALIGGDTFGVDTDCNSCYQNAPTLPDLIEASGRTWKGYFEDMPEACYSGDAHNYAQKHNPFMYFDSIRLDATRCQKSVVPLTQLNADLASGALPDFVFIVPNLCNDAHDCGVDVADTWLDHWVPPLMHTPAYAEGGLIVLTWDEGQGEHTCCELPTGGGRIATVLISPWVKQGFEDNTPYTTYSLLKTISAAWGLPYLGHAADKSNVLIVKPWKR